MAPALSHKPPTSLDQPGGQPVVFLHGGGQTRASWKRALEALAERGFRVISLDLRGHGDSDWAPDGDYALDRFVDDLEGDPA